MRTTLTLTVLFVFLGCGDECKDGPLEGTYDVYFEEQDGGDCGYMGNHLIHIPAQDWSGLCETLEANNDACESHVTRRCTNPEENISTLVTEDHRALDSKKTEIEGTVYLEIFNENDTLLCKSTYLTRGKEADSSWHTQ